MSAAPTRRVPAATPDKARRQRAILDVLAEESIGSQDELGRALRRRGHPVTQATLSRDLKDLRVGRVPVEGGYRYAVGAAAATPSPAAAAQQLRQVATLEVTGIDANEIGVVVFTLTGRAQGVAVWLDGLKDPDLLGTIAGDDTILVLPRSIKKTARLRANLARVLGLA